MEDHLKSGERKVSEGSAEKDGVAVVQSLDGDGVVEGDGVGGLRVLVSGVLGDELHLGVVVGVASHLEMN